MMLPWRYRVPRTARHDGSGHRNDYDLENQSCGRDRSSRRRSTTVLTWAGISEPSLLNTRCNIRSVATTSWPLSILKRSAHLRTGRRRTLNGYLELIRSTSLTRSCVLHRTSSLKELQSSYHLSTKFPFTSLRLERPGCFFCGGVGSAATGSIGRCLTFHYCQANRDHMGYEILISVFAAILSLGTG
jgi:hypothetical protein